MLKHIERLQFITHESAPHTQVEQVLAACQAGAKWIQYRSLTKPEDEILADLEQITSICDDWGTTLIVTDHVQLKYKADIQGIHIDNPQTDISGYRAILGDEYILGASATTIDEVVQHALAGADYIGFGPFQQSRTKPNSFDLVSLEAYTACVLKLKELNLNVPVLAVGGICLEDVEALLLTGIHGIAISESIYSASDMEMAYDEFYKAVLGVSLK